MQKLIKTKTIYPIDEFNSTKHRNILSDSGLPGRKQVSSVSRANFWSVDENSLLSQNMLHLDTFEDDEHKLKDMELG